MRKGSKLYSVCLLKCPRCHEGDLFLNKNPYTFNKQFADMHKACEACGQDFRIEPGFYFGAAYLSYGYNILFGIILFLIGWFGLRIQEWYMIVIFISVVSVMLSPYTYALSRATWLNFFVSYKENNIK